MSYKINNSSIGNQFNKILGFRLPLIQSPNQGDEVVVVVVRQPGPTAYDGGGR